MLPPGLSLAWNGTGKPEPVGGAAAQPIEITLSFDATAQAVLSESQIRAIKYTVRSRGGGSVQKAFGKPGVS
jgi:hypothetical protein